MYCLPSTLTNINVLGKQYMQFRFVNICEGFLDKCAWIGRFETVYSGQTLHGGKTL